LVFDAKEAGSVVELVRVRAARRLSPEEVIRKIGEYSKTFGASSPDNYATGLGKEEMKKRSELAEWKELMEAYQAYEEGGELDYVVEEDLKMDPQMIERVFTRKRLELIAAMGHTEFTSISHLASHLGRDIKNVYEDLRVLRKAGILRLTRARKNVQPKLLIDGVSLVFR
jgi:DNA-binding transcriptional ArsR family regulator